MTRKDRILGMVRRCARCRDWWPDDDEFYYRSNPTYCRACWTEYHRDRAALTARRPVVACAVSRSTLR